MKPKVLVVDDDAAVRFALEEALESSFEVTSAASAEEGMTRLEGASAVLTDLVMPGSDGLTFASKLRELDPELPVVLLTAHGSERTAVQAMKSGVYDYLTKPFAIDELRLVLGRAVEAYQLRRQARHAALERVAGHDAIGQSRAFRTLIDQVRRVGPRDVTVLLRGETGTGKELVAAAIHAESARKDGPFVRFNCAAIPDELAESELFGHVRGAFTGAAADRRGFFVRAHGGTLVLDEVAELPLATQASLLRALQSGEVQRLGAPRLEHVDVRVVACTHRDLRAEIAAGRFREDLYYRLAVVELVVPPLRERRDDIPLLVEALRRRWSARFGIDEVSFSPALVKELAARDWPGNVRELENAVTRMLALSAGGEIGVEALALLEGGARPAVDTSAPLRSQVDAFERDLVARVLGECSGNQSEAARRLGITRTTLIDKLKRHGLAGR